MITVNDNFCVRLTTVTT